MYLNEEKIKNHSKWRKTKGYAFLIASQMYLNTEVQFCAGFNLFWLQATARRCDPILTFPLHLI